MTQVELSRNKDKLFRPHLSVFGILGKGSIAAGALS